MCGDSTDKEMVARLMDGTYADMMMTDPPYNVDYGEKAEAINPYGYHFSTRHIENDKMSDVAFLAFLTSAFDCARDSLKNGASFYIWHASSTLYEFETALKQAGLQTRQQLIWNKSSMVLGRQDYQWKHEPCLYGWKDGAGHYFVDDRKQTTVFEDAHPNFKKMKKDELVNLLDEIYSDKISATVISESKPSSSAEHPTMKPIKLMARLIKNSSKPAETVVDIFGGSGSTLIACEQLDRTCYMMELDCKYVDVIIKRWENLTGETAVLL
jgi:DNA modification methylase